MQTPFSPLHFVLFVIALIFLLVFVQIGLLTIAFDKLGLSSASAFLLLFASLMGSAINLPLFTLKSERPQNTPPPVYYGILRLPQLAFTGKTRITINVGGGLIPLVFSIYLINHNPLAAVDVLTGIVGVSLISYFISRPVHGIGIGMPIFIAPICAALMAVFIDPQLSAPLAYVSGTMGVLIGADLMRLHNIRQMGIPMASIGGAGTFDGIFITGIVAVLLA
ncbi:DUF1614 domain-containing protein [Kaarinaea lacus]